MGEIVGVMIFSREPFLKERFSSSPKNFKTMGKAPASPCCALRALGGLLSNIIRKKPSFVGVDVLDDPFIDEN